MPKTVVGQVPCIFFGKRGLVIPLTFAGGHPTGTSYKGSAFSSAALEASHDLIIDVLEPHPTSAYSTSNLLELHSHRESKVYRVPLHEFGVVRLNRTFSACIFTGDRRSEGAICTSWVRFKHIEPHRTSSNYKLTEIARYIEFFYTSSGWFDRD